jgi:hypothetical protein
MSFVGVTLRRSSSCKNLAVVPTPTVRLYSRTPRIEKVCDSRRSQRMRLAPARSLRAILKPASAERFVLTAASGPPCRRVEE